MLYEIRFHGRGGQGAVTAAELLAVAAAKEGKFVNAFPFFGVERRGAPVQSFCRISDKPIRIRQNIYFPDVAVVLDETLLSDVDICAGLKKEGTAIINTKQKSKDLCLKAKNIHTVDATGIALKHIGKPIVNTAMLGALVCATKVVSVGSLESAIKERFNEKLAVPNVKAIKECAISTL